MTFSTERMPSRLRCASAFLIVVLPLATGCGSPEGYGRVTGTVKLDGQPLPNALVEFIPQEGKGPVSMGRTGTSGEYETMYSRTGKGATLGKNKVRITTYDLLDEGGRVVKVPEKVPTKYNSETELSVDVQPGDNTFDFDLKGEGEIKEPAEVH